MPVCGLTSYLRADKGFVVRAGDEFEKESVAPAGETGSSLSQLRYVRAAVILGVRAIKGEVPQSFGRDDRFLNSRLINRRNPRSIKGQQQDTQIGSQRETVSIKLYLLSVEA